MKHSRNQALAFALATLLTVGVSGQALANTGKSAAHVFTSEIRWNLDEANRWLYFALGLMNAIRQSGQRQPANVQPIIAVLGGAQQELTALQKLVSWPVGRILNTCSRMPQPIQQLIVLGLAEIAQKVQQSYKFCRLAENLVRKPAQPIGP